MKFWQKVFFPVLLLFLVLLNVVVFAIYSITYGNYSTGEKDRTASEQYALSVALARDFTTLRENNRLDDSTTKKLMESYGTYYNEDGIILCLFREDQPLYPEEALPFSLSPRDEAFTIIKTHRNQTWACAGGKIPNFEQYSLLYLRNITASEETWDHTLVILCLLSIGVSIVLAFLLMAIVSSLTSSLSRLAKVADEVAAGDYDSVVVIKGKDEIAQLAGSFNHMTEEICGHIAKLEEESLRKQLFLDNFTHELRTPLTNIYGYSEFMLRVNVSEEDRYRYLDYIMRESKRLNLMSTELFQLTVLRHDIPDMALCSCQDILEAVKESLDQKASEKGVSISIRPTHSSVYGSWALLQSLVNNLTENAIRASEVGGTILLLFTENENRITLQVRDTGRGMTPDQLSRITEPFYRVDRARTRAEGGVGLGLYLCNEIVQLHKAKLHFRSQPNVGTEVTVEFPLHSAKTDSVSPSSGKN